MTHQGSAQPRPHISGCERVADRGLRRALVCTAHSLGHAPDPTALEASILFGLPPLQRNLAAALRDAESKRSDVRRSAVIDLVRYVDTPERPQIVATVERILRHDSDPTVRSLAAMVIADGGLVELVPALFDALEDASPRVQQLALLGLGELGNGEDMHGMDRVRELLRSPLPALRYQALMAWRRLRGDAAGEEMLIGIGDIDAEVRWVAWTLVDEALARAGLPSRDGEEAYLGFGRDRLLVALRAKCDDSELRIRIVAAAVMMRLGEPASMAQLLRQATESTDISKADKVALAERFGEAQFQPARAWLSAHARLGWFEGALGWPATVALASLGEQTAQQAILRELDARSARRRSRALTAIRQLKLGTARQRLTALAATSTGWEAALVREVAATLGDE